MITQVNDNTDWDMRLVKVQWFLNNSINRITKCKPFNIIHRYSSTGIIENPLINIIKQLNEKLGVNSPQNYPTILLRKNIQKEK